MIFPNPAFRPSGARFSVHYRLASANSVEARTVAEGICLEQTVEVPAGLLGGGDQWREVAGRIESLAESGPQRFDVAISYAVETTAGELTQLLNVVFGNSAMQPGIRVLRLDLPGSVLSSFQGPRFGQPGLRDLLAVPNRPLLCTALKPLGLSAPDLAGLAYQLALGGIDIVKEDHGLTNQPFAGFIERVGRCAEAIHRASQHTHQTCLYMPNVTAPTDQVVPRAYAAKDLGAAGVMLAPGLAGWDALRLLAEDDDYGLPILCHPALLGTFAICPDHGLSHQVVFGQLPRLAGADATIFVNFGGRFSFSQQDCREIVDGATQPMGHLQTIFPVPAGGMTRRHLPKMVEFYGRQAIFLIAGGLYAHGPDLAESARQFRRAVERFA